MYGAQFEYINPPKAQVNSGRLVYHEATFLIQSISYNESQQDVLSSLFICSKNVPQGSNNDGIFMELYGGRLEHC